MSDRFPDSEWQNCPGGMLADVAARQRRARRNRQLKRAIPLALVIIGLGVAPVFWSTNTSDKPPGQVSAHWTCEQTLDVMMAYLHDELGRDDRNHVDEHLGHCHFCRAKYDEERAKLIAAIERAIWIATSFRSNPANRIAGQLASW